MKIRKRAFNSSDDSYNFWPSFTDLISTVALVLFFLMLLAYMQNIITGVNLNSATAMLEDKQSRLNIVLSDLEKTERSLSRKKDDLKDAEAIIDLSSLELDNLRLKLQDVATLRVDVLNKVKVSLEEQLGTEGDKSLVEIKNNANLSINEKLLFGSGEYILKPDSKKVLDAMAIAFEKVLDDAEVRYYIDAIAVQGHTDKEGDSDYNRELSTKRANSVLKYLMKSNPRLESKYARYFASSGYSEHRPLNQGETPAAYAENRRIEIAVIISDPSIQNIIQEYLNETREALQ